MKFLIWALATVGAATVAWILTVLAYDHAHNRETAR